MVTSSANIFPSCFWVQKEDFFLIYSIFRHDFFFLNQSDLKNKESEFKNK